MFFISFFFSGCVLLPKTESFFSVFVFLVVLIKLHFEFQKNNSSSFNLGLVCIQLVWWY